MFIILFEINQIYIEIKMNYFEINDLLSKEILPQINDIISNFLEDKFSYIENEEDLEDLEDYEVDDELIDIVKSGIYDVIAEVKDDYKEELSKVDEDINENELINMIESSVNDYKDIMAERIREEFDKEDFFEDYYSDIEF
jgi:hypothetical protein